MASVTVIVIAIAIFNAVISALGKDNLAEYVWYIWTTFAPTEAAQRVRKLRALQREAIAKSTEQANTSSQDEFAKWAKLNRQVDKLKAEIEQLGGTIGAQRQFFKSQVKRLIWLSTTGIKFFVRIKFRKTPVFWLPKGMFPGWIEWILSLTSAPKGSVSVAAWFMIVDYGIKEFIVYAVAKSIDTMSKRRIETPKVPEKAS